MRMRRVKDWSTVYGCDLFSLLDLVVTYLHWAGDVPTAGWASQITVALGPRASILLIEHPSTPPSRSAQDRPSSRGGSSRIWGWVYLERRRSPNKTKADLPQLCSGVWAKPPPGTRAPWPYFVFCAYIPFGQSRGKLALESQIWDPTPGPFMYLKVSISMRIQLKVLIVTFCLTKQDE